MKVDILNKKFEFNPAEDDFENIVYTIFKVANKSGRFIDYLVVDGVAVKHDFLNYLEENLDKIKHIEVISMSVKDSIITSLMGFNDFVSEQVHSLDLLEESLSKEVGSDSIIRLESLMEGIAIISFQFDKIDDTLNLNDLIPSYELWNEFAVEVFKLRVLAPDIDYATHTGENERLAEIVRKDLKPIFSNMSRILSKLLEDKNKK